MGDEGESYPTGKASVEASGCWFAPVRDMRTVEDFTWKFPGGLSSLEIKIGYENHG